MKKNFKYAWLMPASIQLMFIWLLLAGCGSPSGEVPVPGWFEQFSDISSQAEEIHLASLSDTILFPGNVNKNELKPLPRSFNDSIDAPPYQDTLWAWARIKIPGENWMLIYAGRQGSMTIHFYAIPYIKGKFQKEGARQLTGLEPDEMFAMEAWLINISSPEQFHIAQQEARVGNDSVSLQSVSFAKWDEGEWKKVVGKPDSTRFFWCGPGFKAITPEVALIESLRNWFRGFAKVIFYKSFLVNKDFWRFPCKVSGVEIEKVSDLPQLSFCPDARVMQIWREPGNNDDFYGARFSSGCENNPASYEGEISFSGKGWKICELHPLNPTYWLEFGEKNSGTPVRRLYKSEREYLMEMPGELPRWERKLILLEVLNTDNGLHGKLTVQGTTHEVSEWKWSAYGQSGKTWNLEMEPVYRDGESQENLHAPEKGSCNVIFLKEGVMILENDVFIDPGIILN